MKVTIAIPTKDRPHVIGAAISRALSQTYQDVEVLIVDNSADETTRQLVDKIIDPRVRYLRTGDLSMAENWNMAVSSGEGDLIYIIADKLLLHNKAIERLVKIATTTNAEAFSFSGNPRARKSEKSKTWQRHSTSDLIDRALTGDLSLFQQYGFHGYSLIARKTLIDRLRVTHGSIILPLSPDYTFAFMVALNTDAFYYLDWCPFEYASNSASNGFSGAYQGPLFQQFLADNKMTVEQTYEFAPIKVRTIWNSVLSDFFRVAKASGLHFDYTQINLKEYWKRLFSELIYYASLTHIDSSAEFRKLFVEMEKNPELQANEIHEFLAENRLATGNDIARLTTKSFVARAKAKIYRVFSRTA